jgi:3-phenylpropionate/trans-cinnamate dioxygenase ferredoxin reductase subunit
VRGVSSASFRSTAIEGAGPEFSGYSSPTISHSFWSDQYEHLIEYVGFAASWDRLVVRGHPGSRTFLGFYLKDGIVRAAVGLNRGGDPEDSKGDGELKIVANLIRHRVAVDPTRLEDENADLHQLTVAAP